MAHLWAEDRYLGAKGGEKRIKKSSLRDRESDREIGEREKGENWGNVGAGRIEGQSLLLLSAIAQRII